MSKKPVPKSLTGAAKEAWPEVCDLDAPVHVLEALAVQIARLRDARARIDEEGLIIEGDKGKPVEHPALAIERAAQTEIRRIYADHEPRPAGHRVWG